MDLGDRLANTSHDSNDFATELSDKANTPEQADGSLWPARDLEMYCLQNSSIGLVLSQLQVGIAENGPHLL